MTISRRQFIQGAGLAAAALLTNGARGAAKAAAPSARRRPSDVPSPDASGIDHIVVVCMENRSFDHFLGWVPNANGRQGGLVYLDDAGQPHKTHHLQDWQGCGFNDPDHSYEGGRIQYDGGRIDGFRRGDNDDYALGYYTKDDLEMTSAVVDKFTIFDGWFASILGPTYPNRFYTHAAQTDRISNTSDTSTLPTVWDNLAAAGVPATYYFSDLPFLALWGTKYASIAKPVGQFFAQAASGTLPAYSYLDPFFLGEDQGGSNDDHPHADIRRGQAFISEVVQAVTNGPKWANTLLLVTYDEWGGFFDHVVPPTLPDAFVATDKEEHNTAGFRVPAYIVSPFAAAGQVDHGQYDHTSILKLVEWRWSLPPLTVRDTTARNPVHALDFSRPNLVAPTMPLVADPGPHVCSDGATGMANAGESFWEELAANPAVRSYQWA